MTDACLLSSGLSSPFSRASSIPAGMLPGSSAFFPSTPTGCTRCAPKSTAPLPDTEPALSKSLSTFSVKLALRTGSVTFLSSTFVFTSPSGSSPWERDSEGTLAARTSRLDAQEKSFQRAPLPPFTSTKSIWIPTSTRTRPSSTPVAFSRVARRTRRCLCPTLAGDRAGIHVVSSHFSLQSDSIS